MATFVAGQKVRASELNALPQSVVCTSDQTVNNSTTLQNVTGISFSVDADTRYAVEVTVIYTSNPTADLKLGWSYPTGTTGYWASFGITTADTNRIGPIDGGALSEASTLTVTGDSDFAGVAVMARPAFTFLTSSTSGTVQLRFAQATANASNTVIKAGSYATLLKLT